jgi:hypothetical protein
VRGHTLAPSQSGTVVLELGPHCGVLIVHCAQGDLHREIDISPVGRPGARTHSAVRERHVAAGVVYAALYPDLTPGEYTIHAEPPGTVTVPGGSIAEYRL